MESRKNLKKIKIKLSKKQLNYQNNLALITKLPSSTLPLTKLNIVLNVTNIHCNLVSVSLLGKAGVKILFDSDKIVLTKNDAFVGKGYCNKGYLC